MDKITEHKKRALGLFDKYDNTCASLHQCCNCRPRAGKFLI